VASFGCFDLIAQSVFAEIRYTGGVTRRSPSATNRNLPNRNLPNRNLPNRNLPNRNLQ
jgi:hypothetical protein